MGAIHTETLEEKIETIFQWVKKQQSSSAKDKARDVWTNEADAAALLGYTPEWFRRKVKDGTIAIHYRNTNGRKYEYLTKDILEYKESTSTIV